MMKWDLWLTVLLAIVAASLIEHLVIAPRMAHSPAITAARALGPQTADEFVKAEFPNATTV